MKRITDKEYEAYMKYKYAKANGMIFTPDCLDNLIQAFGNDAYALGKHLMEVNYRFKNGRHSLGAWFER